MSRALVRIPFSGLIVFNCLCLTTRRFRRHADTDYVACVTYSLHRRRRHDDGTKNLTRCPPRAAREGQVGCSSLTVALRQMRDTVEHGVVIWQTLFLGHARALKRVPDAGICFVLMEISRGGLYRERKRRSKSPAVQGFALGETSTPVATLPRTEAESSSVMRCMACASARSRGLRLNDNVEAERGVVAVVESRGFHEGNMFGGGEDAAREA